MGILLLRSIGVVIGVYLMHAECASVTLDIHGQDVDVYGISETFEGNGYHKYLGIPFAQPPVDSLRFRKPEPVLSMESPFNATQFGMPCVQFGSDDVFPQSEDCLYLNIYTPGRPADSASGHAVAVWIHGGSLMKGSGSSYDGTFLSLIGNVIVVTINYRLGLFGSLSTEDDDAPGNYAFWDQRMAFKWIQDNIGRFGGDTDRVTLFGESAGAFSVIVHGLAPLNRGLFQRVIAQSGSAIAGVFLKLDKTPKISAFSIGNVLGCESSSSQALLACLRSKPSDDIIRLLKENDISAPFFPYVLDELITHELTTYSSSTYHNAMDEVKFFRSLDVINGFNSHEGAYVLQALYGDASENITMSLTVMRYAVDMLFEKQVLQQLDDSVLEMILGEYRDWTNPGALDMRLQFIKMVGDYSFGVPAVETGLLHAESNTNANNYMYFFSANPSFGPLETPDWVPGANHADELYFVFGMEIVMPDEDPSTSWEIQLSRRMATYWTNFMKSGNPNQPAEVSPVWPPYDTEAQTYLTLQEHTTEESVGQMLYAKERNFWYHVFPAINEAIYKNKNTTDENECVSSAMSMQSSFLLPLIYSMYVLIIV